MDAGQMEGAGEDLRYVMDETSDPELSMIARLRLARVLIHQEAYSDALALLDVDPGLFSGRFNEVRGDVYVALSDPESARNAYNAALTSQVSDQVDRNLVQIKLESLPETESAMIDEVAE
jgi:predicted negative regulator of RcsB-dependent stress response